ncbi:uncharacterized protein PAC_13065 [Phialocephala subalpina]|uniref:Uncharacterized protein n=1 Tax=Phialocephala subalpina TaxID=576137 RepID=A0A1L7XDS6_9HELO|nr:uncharacterized protein PAC_13065 [Phialocephala subalpina]
MRSSPNTADMALSRRHLRPQDGLSTSLQNRSSTRRRSCYSPQRRLEVAKVRKVGACVGCRRKKVGCSHVLQTGASTIAGSGSPLMKEEVNASSHLGLDMLPKPDPPSSTQESELLRVIHDSEVSCFRHANSRSMETQSQPQSMVSSNGHWREAETILAYKTSTHAPQIAPLIEISYANHTDMMFPEENGPSALSQDRETTPTLSWVSSPAIHHPATYEGMPNLHFLDGTGQTVSVTNDTSTPGNVSLYYDSNPLPAANASYYYEESTHTGAYLTPPMVENNVMIHSTQLAFFDVLPNDVFENAK